MGVKNECSTLVVVAMVLILLMNPVLMAWGTPPPGRWEKVAQTEPMEKMVVYTNDDGKNKYSFQSLDNQFLVCRDENNQDIQIDLSSIRKIVLPRTGRLAKEWALWGAVGGAVGGAVFPAATNLSGFDYTTGGFLAFAGIGALLGALGGGVTGAALGASGETIYISEEAAQAGAK